MFWGFKCLMHKLESDFINVLSCNPNIQTALARILPCPDRNTSSREVNRCHSGPRGQTPDGRKCERRGQLFINDTGL